MANGQVKKRELYAPGHFGNSYEVAPRFEMRAILSEAKWWGFNWYGDWFDTVNLTKDSHLHKNLTLNWLTRAVWENKKVHFEEAGKLGFVLDFLISPNHVFADQCQDSLRADDDNGAVYGHLVCPSIPEARGIILGNYNEWFRDLKESGVFLNALTAAPYDWGGCRCDKCRPWITTFLQLSKEIHECAQRHFPGIEMHFCGWYITTEENELFVDWLERNSPGWARSLSLWIAYGEDKPRDPFPPRMTADCAMSFFIHIGYPDKETMIRYGQWGPAIAPARIPATIRNLDNSGGTGFSAYSEGIHDDVNKALLAGLSSDKFRTVPEVLEAYAERYFAAKGAAARAWSEWLTQWGEPFGVELKKARRDFERLSSSTPETWRLQQWRSALKLFEAHAAISGAREWTPARDAAVEEFLIEKEHLKRGIYGLPPIEESSFAFTGMPEWYREWTSRREQVGTAADEQR